MRRIALLSLSIVTLLLSSCKNENKQTVNIQQDITVTDTVSLSEKDQVTKTVEQYLELMRSYRFKEAIAMLNVWDEHEQLLFELSKEKSDELLIQFESLKGVDYKLESISLNGAKNNLIKYSVVLFDKPSGDNTPNTIQFGLIPMRLDGDWYLVLPDAFSSSAHDPITLD